MNVLEHINLSHLENGIVRDETLKIAAEAMIATFNKKLSCRREIARRFVLGLLNISLKIIRSDAVE